MKDGATMSGIKKEKAENPYLSEREPHLLQSVFPRVKQVCLLKAHRGQRWSADTVSMATKTSFLSGIRLCLFLCSQNKPINISTIESFSSPLHVNQDPQPQLMQLPPTCIWAKNFLSVWLHNEVISISILPSNFAN